MTMTTRQVIDKAKSILESDRDLISYLNLHGSVAVPVVDLTANSSPQAYEDPPKIDDGNIVTFTIEEAGPSGRRLFASYRGRKGLAD